AMRYALMEYNKDAAAFTKMQEGKATASYKPQIKIGCGINTGRATCGIMGSTDKMEYTAIGDSVNFASRTEASNKACGTDILISQDTYNVLKQDYIRCSENNFTLSRENEKDEIIVEMIPVEFEVKGKGSQHFYGVVNMPQFNIEEFFKITDKDFKVDFDCARSVGPRGPKTLKDVRDLLGIPTPEFENLNLGQDENKVQIKQ
ncbi:MAG: adenylate/guanylate cyclase domain-containing protein, partial [Treponema sp.]|nr:adenylate/guanylate cyclase domain-containing protein [Treponema sp.]